MHKGSPDSITLRKNCSKNTEEGRPSVFGSCLLGSKQREVSSGPALTTFFSTLPLHEVEISSWKQKPDYASQKTKKDSQHTRSPNTMEASSHETAPNAHLHRKIEVRKVVQKHCLKSEMPQPEKLIRICRRTRTVAKCLRETTFQLEYTFGFEPFFPI